MNIRELFNMARELAKAKIELRQALKLAEQWKKTAEGLYKEVQELKKVANG